MRDSGAPVEVATFLYFHEAEMARAALEAQGIEATILDQEMARANWMLTTAIGGVKLQVAAADADRAREVLGEDRTGEALDWEEGAQALWGGAPPPSARDERCPSCGASNPSYARFSKLAILLTIVLLGVPILVLRRRYTCTRCLETWKEGEGGPPSASSGEPG